MQHNLDLGPDAPANTNLAILRGLTLSGQIGVDAIDAPGLSFAIDPESITGGSFSSEPGMLLQAKFEVEKPGRWMALHLQLGPAALTDAQIAGFVLKSDAPETITFRACLRSGIEGGFVDCFFPKRVISFADTSVHVDVLKLGENEPLPATAPWRELILFFERKSQEVVLRDLRVFIV